MTSWLTFCHLLTPAKNADGLKQTLYRRLPTNKQQHCCSSALIRPISFLSSNPTSMSVSLPWNQNTPLSPAISRKRLFLGADNWGGPERWLSALRTCTGLGPRSSVHVSLLSEKSASRSDYMKAEPAIRRDSALQPVATANPAGLAACFWKTAAKLNASWCHRGELASYSF